MPLELDLGPAAQEFREEVRAWLQDNAPKELIGLSADMVQRGQFAGAREWADALTEAG